MGDSSDGLQRGGHPASLSTSTQGHSGDRHRHQLVSDGHAHRLGVGPDL